MRITMELSLYPLDPGFTGPITDFILALRREPGLEIVSNAMSTQLRGEFDAVWAAVGRCSKVVMAGPVPMVLVAKLINADLDIRTVPRVGAEAPPAA